jgi:hypothetical protein
LNKLDGFDVTDFEILVKPESDGTNMIGTVYIPNPSVMTITMVSYSTQPKSSKFEDKPSPQKKNHQNNSSHQGTVTFNNYVQGDYIGNTTISDLVLVPGNNTVPMRSIIDQAAVIKKVVASFPDGLLPIDIIGHSSVYKGENLPYFEKALAASTEHITLDVGEKLKAVGFQIPGGS